MGGEISGTIDESIRHAVTKLAHLHFPANQAGGRAHHPDGRAARHRARRRLSAHRSGQRDRAAADGGMPHAEWLDREGVGAHIDVDQAVPAGQPASGDDRVRPGQGADLGNADGARRAADADDHAVAERRRRLGGHRHAACGRSARSVQPEYIRFYKNFPIETYVRLMLLCACTVGNSSAPIREGAFLGVPAVNIGTRQTGRDRGANVRRRRLRPRTRSSTAIRRQLAHGRYPSDHAVRRRPGRRAHRRRAGDARRCACRSGSCSRSRSDAACSASSRRAAARRAIPRKNLRAARPAGRCWPTPPMRRAAAGG